MIVLIHLDRFYSCDLPAARPMVVVRQRKVLDANDLAIRFGIAIGMEISQAKPILAKNPMQLPAGFVDWNEEDFAERREAWLMSCTPFTDIIEPDDQHRAYLDLSAHPEPETILEPLLQSVSSGVGNIEPRIAIGQCKWTATAAFDSHDPEQLAYFAPNAFLDELPTSLMLPVSQESRSRLEFLGYHRAGEVRDIPVEVLRSQFGKEALIIHSASRGRGGDAVLPLFPNASISDRIYFESPVENCAQIDHALDSLSKRLGKRLSKSDLHSTHMRLHLGLEDDVDVREREFSKPLLGPGGIRFAANLLSEIDKPVAFIRIELLNLSKAGRKQNELYCMRTDSQDVIDQSVRKVQKLFGEVAVRRGNEIPLSRRQRLLRAWSNATGWA